MHLSAVSVARPSQRGPTKRIGKQKVHARADKMPVDPRIQVVGAG